MRADGVGKYYKTMRNLMDGDLITSKVLPWVIKDWNANVGFSVGELWTLATYTQ
jgi:hypothetical protein